MLNYALCIMNYALCIMHCALFKAVKILSDRFADAEV